MAAQLGNRTAKGLLGIHKGVLSILPLLAAPDRLATGLVLADIKELWPLALHVAHSFLVASVAGVASADAGTHTGSRFGGVCHVQAHTCGCSARVAAGTAAAATRAQVEEFVRQVYDWKLERIWERERLLNVRNAALSGLWWTVLAYTRCDGCSCWFAVLRSCQGNDMKQLGASGQDIGLLVAAQLRWQIMHDAGTKEECAAAMRDVLTRLPARHQGKAKKTKTKKKKK